MTGIVCADRNHSSLWVVRVRDDLAVYLYPDRAGDHCAIVIEAHKKLSVERSDLDVEVRLTMNATAARTVTRARRSG